VRFLLKITTFFRSIGDFCFENRLNAMRFAVVFLLGLTLGFNYLRFQAGQANPGGDSAVAEGEEVGQPGRNGIGGAYLEDDGFEAQLASLMLADGGEADESQKPRLLLYETHSIQSGELIGSLAIRYGLNEDTILSVNGIKNSRLLQIGQVLRIPNQDGILSTVEGGDTLDTMAEKYGSGVQAIKVANQLFAETATEGTELFIPGGRLSWTERQEINGDIVIWPVAGRITSSFGWRRDPFGSGRQEFHNGIDISARIGTPIRAAMAGRISSAGFDPVWGNFAIINHSNGYRTMYAHMSRIRVRQGDFVGSGQQIGDVGSTGRSTGPHLHFTVFKNTSAINPRTVLR